MTKERIYHLLHHLKPYNFVYILQIHIQGRMFRATFLQNFHHLHALSNPPLVKPYLSLSGSGSILSLISKLLGYNSLYNI